VVGSLLRHVGEWLTSRNMTLGTTRKIWLVAFARNISWNDEFTMPPVMGGVLARSISWLISSFLRHVLVSIALATRSCLFPCSCSRSCSLSCHCGHVRCASAVTTDRDHGVGSSQMPSVRRMKRGICMLYAVSPSTQTLDLTPRIFLALDQTRAILLSRARALKAAATRSCLCSSLF
jgi:hypothetical protein